MNNFGENIFEARKNKELTQEALAEMLGVTAQAVSKWERGESMPDAAILPELARVLDTSIDSLFGINQTPIVEYVPVDPRELDKKILRISVNDDGDNVNINIPFALVKVAMETGIGTVSFGNTDMSKIDFTALIEMINNGAIGKLLEVDSDDGSHVVIEVI